MHHQTHSCPAVVLAAVLLLCGFAARADEKFDKLMEEQKYKRAIQHAERNIPPEGRSIEIWLALARAHQNLNEKELALTCYKEAQKVNPSEPRVYLGFGKAALEQEKYEEALEHFGKSYVLKRTAAAAEGVAVSAAMLGQWDKARDAAESAVGLDSAADDARMVLGKVYLEQKDYANAALQLETIAKKQPSNVKLLKQLAACYVNTGDTARLADLDPKIVKLDEKDVLSRRRLAQYSFAKKDSAAAYDLYRELAILVPEDPVVFKQLYLLANGMNKKKDALLYLRNYLVLDSTSAQAYKAMGDLLYDEKDSEAALRCYRKAVALDPDIKGVYRRYAYMLIEGGMDDEIPDAVMGAIEGGEADAACYVALGDLRRKQGKCSEAVSLYQEALKTEATNVGVLLSLGQCQSKIGDISGASATYEQVVKLKPDAGEVYKALGDLHAQTKRTEEAMEAYKKYLEKKPSDYGVALNVGLYEYSHKRYGEAAAYLELVKDTALHDLTYFQALGLSYYHADKCEKAIKSLSTIRAKKPPTAVLKATLKPLAECYQKTGDHPGAAGAYADYIKLGVRDADASYMSAFLVEKQDTAAAVKGYAGNTKVFPKDYRNFLRLGVIYSRDSTKLKTAFTVLERAATLNDTVPLVWETLGDVYFRLNNGTKALAAYRKLLALAPKHGAANRRIGAILAGRKQYADAMAFLETALSADPNDVRSMVFLAKAYKESGHPKEAVDVLFRAKEADPRDVDLRLLLLTGLKETEQKELLEKETEDLAKLDKKTIARDKKNVDSRVRLADYSYAKDDLKEAHQVYRELSELTPNEAALWLRLQEIAAKLGDEKKAMEYAKHYAALDVKSPQAQRSLGDLLYEQEQYDEALESYRAAVKLDPKIKGVYKRYTDILKRKGLAKELVTALHAAIDIGEADAGTYASLGEVHRKQNQCAKAVPLFEKALEMEPQDTATLSRLIQCQIETNDIHAAIGSCERLRKLNPESAETYKALGDLHSKQNAADDAAQAYVKYLAMKPHDGEIAQKVAYYKYGKQEYKEALRYLTSVKDSALKDARHYAVLGLSYFGLGNCEKTIEVLSALRERKPAAPTLAMILKPLASCYEKTGEKPEAAAIYETYAAVTGEKDADAAYMAALLKEETDTAAAVKLYERNATAFPNDYRNFLHLGIIYGREPAKLSKASVVLTKASKLIDSDPFVWQMLAEVHGRLGNTQQELAVYEKVLALQPDNFRANKRTGAILIEKKQITAGTQRLEAALESGERDVETMKLLADAYVKAGRRADAIDILQKAKKLAEKDEDVRFTLYTLYKQEGEKEEAEKEIWYLIVSGKENRHRILYANDLIREKRYEEAEKVLTQVKQSDPDNIDALMELGRILAILKKYDDAMELYKSVLFVKDNYVPALFERAELYLEQGDGERAKQYYEKVLKLDPKHARAKAGLAKASKVKKAEPKETEETQEPHVAGAGKKQAAEKNAAEKEAIKKDTAEENAMEKDKAQKEGQKKESLNKQTDTKTADKKDTVEEGAGTKEPPAERPAHNEEPPAPKATKTLQAQ